METLMKPQTATQQVGYKTAPVQILEVTIVVFKETAVRQKPVNAGGMTLIGCKEEGRDGTCKSTRNQGERYPWAVVLNPAEDIAKNRQASVQSVKTGTGNV